MTYVVFKEQRKRDKHFQATNEVYWTGDFAGSGRPAETSRIDKIKEKAIFKTARQAYNKAGIHTCLCNWKVGRRP
jgi:hypothetical protein